jgi:hypothetical protein
MSLRILENVFMMIFAIHHIIYFLRVKINNLSTQNKQLTNFNIIIILLLITALIFRPFAFVSIDTILIARLISDIKNNVMMQSLWIVVRVFINAPRDLIEASLICYMIYY